MPSGQSLNYPIQHRYSSKPVGSSAFDIEDPLTALAYLNGQLDKTALESARLDLYYDGEQPIAFLPPDIREAVGQRLHNLVINWPNLKVNALEERMDITGFRLPDDQQFERGWEIWQANDMDAQSHQAHIEAFIHGRSYVIVWGGEDGGASISVESPRQVTAYWDPRTRKPTHAIKRWVENDGYAWCVLYDAERIRTYRSKSSNADTSDMYTNPASVADLSHVSHTGWDIQDEIANGLHELPVVPLVNKPRVLSPDGVTELDRSCLDLTDAVNKLALDMMVSSEFHAMPRRWATGVEIEEDEEGNIRETFSPIKGRTWIAEDPASRIGQLPEAELKNFISAMDSLATRFASVAGLAQHMVDPSSGAMASGESRRAAETPIITKAKRAMKSFSGPWEDVMRLAVLVEEGSTTENLESLETVWADPEVRTDAQRMDAASKRKSLGVPLEQVWEDAGYSQTQIENMKKMSWQEVGETGVQDDTAAG